ncbi:MAG TPA: serine/threonine protein kinase, partial [candidate division Zixibacteria bacterium]|nr:serine/threonine protein kinase [candidate division Zixibacteria bacterium]
MFKLHETIEFNGDEYVIDEFLGQGGMGQVFSIINKKDKSKLALKSLQYFIPDDSHHRSLINEWEKAQTISHSNVIKYIGFHDGLSEPKMPYLIMEFANGGSLEDFLMSQNELLSEEDCLDIFHQIIDGMEAVNSVLVHRDIKPDNIFIDKGVFKIADFGLAKIASEKTRTKTFKGWGTEPYIAPEAYRSETNTIQMDMYSIGHVFYQIAGMRHAFGSPSDWEQAHLTAVASPVSNFNPGISPKVVAVIHRLIEKRPGNRYDSWENVRDDLAGSAKNVGGHKSTIDRILGNKNARDTEKQKQLSAQKVAKDEEERKSGLIGYQFENEIIKPLSEFVSDFNEVSGSSQEMSLSKNSRGGDVDCRITFDDKLITIWFHKIDDTDILVKQGVNDWGDSFQRTVEPELNGKHVLAWGGMVTSSHSGLNIVLTSAESGDYGDWFMLTNTHSALCNRQDLNDYRPDPFAFTKSELIKEI